MENQLKAMKANSVLSSGHELEPEEESSVKAQERPAVRYATKEEAEKAHRKVMKVHAGLLRRLAE